MHTKVLFAFLVAFCLQLSLARTFESEEAKPTTFEEPPKQTVEFTGFIKATLDHLYKKNPTMAKKLEEYLIAKMDARSEGEPAEVVHTTQVAPSSPEEINSMSNQDGNVKNGDEFSHVVKDNTVQDD